MLDRLGVGHERLRAENPRLVVCAITGFGQEGPDRDRPGHDLGYLARNGLLALTGEPGGPPVPPAGQIADVGGGALMAAFGIMAALWERERSGEGQLVDVAMTAASQRWLAMVAAGVLAGDPVPRRGELPLAGGLACYRPYRCADGWVALAALEPKFWRALCDGLARPDLVERHLDPGVAPSSRRSSRRARGRSGRRSPTPTRAAWSPCWSSKRRWTRDARGRRGGRAAGRRGPVRMLGAPFRLARTPAEDTRPAPGPGEHTRAVLAELGYAPEEIAALAAGGSGGVTDLEPFFCDLGGGRFRASASTAGPWDPRLQHAGPPAALIGRALEACAPRPDMVLARVTLDILGPVPVGEVAVQAAVARPGRSVELLEATLSADGRAAIAARAWRVARRGAPAAGPAAAAVPPRPDGPAPPAFFAGYGDAVELPLRARRLGRARAGHRVDAAAGSGRGRRGADGPPARARRRGHAATASARCCPSASGCSSIPSCPCTCAARRAASGSASTPSPRWRPAGPGSRARR